MPGGLGQTFAVRFSGCLLLYPMTPSQFHSPQVLLIVQREQGSEVFTAETMRRLTVPELTIDPPAIGGSWWGGVRVGVGVGSSYRPTPTSTSPDQSVMEGGGLHTTPLPLLHHPIKV